MYMCMCKLLVTATCSSFIFRKDICRAPGKCDTLGESFSSCHMLMHCGYSLFFCMSVCLLCAKYAFDLLNFELFLLDFFSFFFLGYK